MMHPSQQSETKGKDNHYNRHYKWQYCMLKCYAVTEIFDPTLSESRDSDLKYEAENIVGKKEQELAKFITWWNGKGISLWGDHMEAYLDSRWLSKLG